MKLFSQELKIKPKGKKNHPIQTETNKLNRETRTKTLIEENREKWFSPEALIEKLDEILYMIVQNFPLSLLYNKYCYLL